MVSPACAPGWPEAVSWGARGGHILAATDRACGAWRPPKASGRCARRPRAILAWHVSSSTLEGASHTRRATKTAARRDYTVERRPRQRYAVLCDLLWCAKETGRQGMGQGGALRRGAVQWQGRRCNAHRSLPGQGEARGKNCMALILYSMVLAHSASHGIL